MHYCSEILTVHGDTDIRGAVHGDINSTLVLRDPDSAPLLKDSDSALVLRDTDSRGAVLRDTDSTETVL